MPTTSDTRRNQQIPLSPEGNRTDNPVPEKRSDEQLIDEGRKRSATYTAGASPLHDESNVGPEPGAPASPLDSDTDTAGSGNRGDYRSSDKILPGDKVPANALDKRP